MSNVTSIETRIRSLIQAFNRQDAAAIASLYAPDATHTKPDSTQATGRASIEEHYANAFAAVPDARFEVKSVLFPRPGTAVVEAVISGTHLGVLRDGTVEIPPTGRHVSVPAVIVSTVNQAGEIQTDQLRYDQSVVLAQIGLVPTAQAQVDAGHSLMESLTGAFNRGDAAGIAALFTEDSVHSFPSVTERRGRQAAQAHYQMLFTAYPNARLTLADVMVEGAQVVSTWTITGTHSGPLGPIPATGRELSLKGVTVAETSPEGLLRCERVYYDRASVLRQLGVLPG
ncbi:MAG: ester cyclase [Bacillota bacterium]